MDSVRNASIKRIASPFPLQFSSGELGVIRKGESRGTTKNICRI